MANLAHIDDQEEILRGILLRTGGPML